MASITCISGRTRHSTCLWLIAIGLGLSAAATAEFLPSTLAPNAPGAVSLVLPQGVEPSGVAGNPGFLPVDQAFVFTPLQDATELLLRWQMPPGYYLYRHRLTVTAGSTSLDVAMPEGLAKVDEYFGEVQVFYDGLDASTTLPAGLDQVTVEYQGCADAGLCYPPVRRTIALPGKQSGK